MSPGAPRPALSVTDMIPAPAQLDAEVWTPVPHPFEPTREKPLPRSGRLQRGLTGVPYVVPAMGSARTASCRALSAA